MDTTRVLVRPMQLRDIHQVSDIEREAFPPPWPATNFRRELTVNTATRYLVACAEVPASPHNSAPGDAASDPRARKSVFHTVMALIARLIGVRPVPQIAGTFILGFAGIWFLADEAHLATIAVRDQWRRRGVGGQLLEATIDLAVKESARLLTLEVRASNEAARAMYASYGFAEVGMRPGYYSDNKEDAILMTIDGISSASFQLNSRLPGAASSQGQAPRSQA
jgi:ribosomal-protein-alanine N-acetyltransferase